MLLKCIAIDNEIWALELIKKYVSKIPSLLLIQTLYDPVVAGEFLKNNLVDLLFIDINIPASIGVLHSLKNKPITIFTTAYEKYALKGFELGVIDYLLKPIDFERFSNAVSRAIELYMFRQYSKHRDEDFLIVRSGHGRIRIELYEIEYIEGFVDYIRIHRANEQPLITKMTLKAMMEKLPPEKFKRIHRSYIVAVSRIKAIQNKKSVVVFLKRITHQR